MMTITLYPRRALPQARSATHVSEPARRYAVPLPNRLCVQPACIGAFDQADFVACQAAVLVVNSGFGKLLTDDDVQRFSGPCTITVSLGGPFTVVNTGACDLSVVVIGLAGA
jgi:hypothetical protein